MQIFFHDVKKMIYDVPIHLKNVSECWWVSLYRWNNSTRVYYCEVWNSVLFA